MNEKIEQLRGILNRRLENYRTTRGILEEAGDLRNALSYFEKEIELKGVLSILSDVFPESSEG